MTRRSRAAADTNAPITGKWSRPIGALATHEPGGRDRGTEDPIPRVTKRPLRCQVGGSRDRWLGYLSVCSRFPIQGDLKLGPRSLDFDGGPVYEPAAADPDPSAPVRDRRCRRRAGTGQPIDRRPGRRATARTLTPGPPGRRERSAERWLLPDRRDGRLRWQRVRRDGDRAVEREGQPPASTVAR